MDAMHDLAVFVRETSDSSLPLEVKQFVKHSIIDTVGVMFAGAEAAGCAAVVDEVAAWGGVAEATIPIFGVRSTVQNVVLATSTMARALDFDDLNEPALGHPSVATVPVALAVAEWIGGVSGPDMITAVAVGNEVFARIGMAPEVGCHVSGMSHTYQAGIFAGTATAGRLLGLTLSELEDAFGIAYSMLQGNQQCLQEGSLTIRVQQGLTAQAAITSVRLARAGVTGTHQTLEGRYGYFNAYHRGAYDHDTLVGGLGEVFQLLQTSVKPYPSCHVTHVAIDAGIKLRERLRSDAVLSQVTLGCNKLAMNLLASDDARRNRPESVMDMQFSVPWAFATGFVKGKAGLDEYSPAALGSVDVQTVVDKTRVVIDPDIEERYGRGPGPVRATIVFDDGTTDEVYVDEVEGYPSLRMSADRLRAKFIDCCDRVTRKRVDARGVLCSLESLEDSDDVSKILLSVCA